ncbi:hypothetical protein PIB30_084974 [Stylosanthes scabra]|uniref:Uncharacterized protein n=1 Tax=Stylosanthes scabra TaxID=79078 RepID=A0ABU6TVJ9_9FABA|nr:hypothetical protein [Stylosanthes scabra]
MSTRRGASSIPWATHSSSPTNSIVSSATSQPTRQRDLPHGDNNSVGPRPRSQTDRVRSETELPKRIYGSSSRMARGYDTNEDKLVDTPLLDISEPPRDERIAIVSLPSRHIADSQGPTDPRGSSVSISKGSLKYGATLLPKIDEDFPSHG